MAKAAVKDMTSEDVVAAVLEASDGALHFSDVTERISTQQLKHKTGANPAAVATSILSRPLEDQNSSFQRTGKGEYALETSLQQAASPPAAELNQGPEEPDTGALRASAVLWQRSHSLSGVGYLQMVVQGLEASCETGHHQADEASWLF